MRSSWSLDRAYLTFRDVLFRRTKRKTKRSMIFRAWTDRLRRKKTGQTIANQHNQQQQKQQRKSARSRMYTVHINTIVSSFCFLGSYSPHIFLFSSFSSMKKRVVIDIDLCSVVFYTQKEAGGIVSYASHVPERSASFSSDFPFLFFSPSTSHRLKNINTYRIWAWHYGIFGSFLTCMPRSFSFVALRSSSRFCFFKATLTHLLPWSSICLCLCLCLCVCVCTLYILLYFPSSFPCVLRLQVLNQYFFASLFFPHPLLDKYTMRPSSIVSSLVISCSLTHFTFLIAIYLLLPGVFSSSCPHLLFVKIETLFLFLSIVSS